MAFSSPRKRPVINKSIESKHLLQARISTGVPPSDRKPESIPSTIPNFDAVHDVVEESASIIKYSVISKADQELTIDQYKADFVELKKQIHEVEQMDVDDVKEANELLKSEIEKLKKALSEEIVRSHAGVRLDINLEKGRIRDEGMQLQEHLRHTDERIEREIRTLRKHMEGIKLQILQYMIGTITGAGTLLLAYRQLME
ncbi:unnamed protein product [Umbelopsis vinacea]